MVVLQPSKVEWPMFPPTGNGSRCLHGQLRRPLKDRHRQGDHQSLMVTRGAGPAHQLEGVESHLASHSASSSQEQASQRHLGQHDDHRLHQQVWRHSLPPAHGSCSTDLVLLPRDRDPSQDHVRAVAVQSSGCSFPQNEHTAGMVHQPGFLPETGFTVGSSHGGPLRIEDQCETQTVRLLEAGTTSTRTRCAQPHLEQQRQIIHLSPLEPNSVDPSETAGGTGSGNSRHPILAERDLVPEDIEMGSGPSDTDSSSDGSSGPREQPLRARQKPDVVSMRLEHRQQTLTADGASSTVLSLLFEDNNSVRRRGAYAGPQRAFARWMEHLDMDPLVPNPVELMNFLAYGYTRNQWSFNTVKVYKTAIFALYNDTTAHPMRHSRS